MNSDAIANDQNRLGDLNEDNKNHAINIRTTLKKEQDKIDKKLSPKKTQTLTSREETDLRVRKTQLASQTTRFFNIWTEYNDDQAQYRDDSKKLLVRKCKVTGKYTNMSDDELENMIDEGKNVFAASVLETEAAKQQLLDLQLRHGEFMKVRNLYNNCVLQFDLYKPYILKGGG